ncbi:MAG TPA: DUF2182 domain-containing protein [Candidatus Dormibacteraeota bacterium]|nr:DUF2182 domain-containing protein [Candidatus Dormibacteraeota bacterium]
MAARPRRAPDGVDDQSRHRADRRHPVDRGRVPAHAPAKRAFLRACHAPASRRSGAARGWAAFATGTRLGLRCLGCCWALMTVMFAVGVMSIAWTAALTALVAIEKMRAPESRTGRVAGAALIAWALVILATAGR